MKLNRLLIPVLTMMVTITSCEKVENLPDNSEVLTIKEAQIASLTPGNNNSNKTRLSTPVLTTTVSGTSLVVSWAQIPNAVEYHVVFDGIGAPSAQKITATSLSLSGLSAGNYSVKVSALAENSNSSVFIDSHFSSASTFTVGSVPPVAETATKLAAPVVTAAGVSYQSGEGKTSVSWANVTNAAGYSVTVNGVPVSSAASPLSLANLEPGTYTVAVTALTGGANYLNSDPGSATFTVNARRPVSTPVISGNVTYSSPSAGSVTVTPLFIWPPNNKLTTVTFVGSGLISTGTGTINASHTTVAHATSYNMTPSTLSNLAPGNYTVSVTAIAGGTYTDDNWVNSPAGQHTFSVAAGSLTYKLTDEYGVYTKDYTLSSNFTLPLQLMASRLGTDMDGRNYTFTITATNGAGTSVHASTVSNVPHDQRK